LKNKPANIIPGVSFAAFFMKICDLIRFDTEKSDQLIDLKGDT